MYRSHNLSHIFEHHYKMECYGQAAMVTDVKYKNANEILQFGDS